MKIHKILPCFLGLLLSGCGLNTSLDSPDFKPPTLLSQTPLDLSANFYDMSESTFKKKYLDELSSSAYSESQHVALLDHLVKAAPFSYFKRYAEQHKLLEQYKAPYTAVPKLLEKTVFQTAVSFQKREHIAYLVSKGFSLQADIFLPLNTINGKMSLDFLQFLTHHGYPLETNTSDLLQTAIVDENQELIDFLFPLASDVLDKTLKGVRRSSRVTSLAFLEKAPQALWAQLFEVEDFSAILAQGQLEDFQRWEQRGFRFETPDHYYLFLKTGIEKNNTTLLTYVLSSSAYQVEEQALLFAQRYRLLDTVKASHGLEPLDALLNSEIPFQDLPPAWIEKLLQKPELSEDQKNRLKGVIL